MNTSVEIKCEFGIFNDTFVFFSGSDVLGSYAAETRDVTSKTWLLQGRALKLFTLERA